MSVPRVILEAQKYREDIVGEQCDDMEEVDYDEDEDGEYSAELDLELSESHKGVKARANYALLQLYNQKGYDVFKRTCIQMKSNKWFDKSEYGFFKGECAEVFLYATILEFINKFNLPWKVYLSLVVQHRDGIEGHTTELDIVLVSQEMITVFEAKSYNGSKELIDLCTIKRKSDSKDIYRQNALHCESLIKQIADYNINDTRGMKSVLFSFAEGSLKDSREPQCKKLIPVLTEDNLLKYLTSLTKLEMKYWKPTIYDRVEELSKKLTMKDHMNYIMKNKT